MAKNISSTTKSSKMRDNFFTRSKFHNTKLPYKKQRDGSEINSVVNDSDNFFVKSNKDVVVDSKQRKESKLEDNKTDKKPFDKKMYRFKKYSNKYKVQQWEDQRKKAVIRNYHKVLKKDERNQNQGKMISTNQPGSSSKAEYMDTENECIEGDSKIMENTTDTEGPRKKRGKFHSAYHQFQDIKEEKKKARELYLQKKSEKEEALRAYKKKKFEVFKRINKKTKKGQPVMKGRIEMLLEKIQNSIQ